jgi:hypothetical protein
LGGPLVGRVDGDPIRDVITRTLWGSRLYAAASALAFAMLIVRGSRPLPTSPIGVGITLAAALLMVIGLLILVGMIAAVSRGRQTGSRTSGVVVRRFRVRALTGDLVSCVLPGDSADDDLRHGDCVRMEGRQHRDGDLSVHRVEILESPAGPTLSVVHARGMGLRAAVVTDRVCLALAVVLVLWVVADRLSLIG